jgi:hypothetical protein
METGKELVKWPTVGLSVAALKEDSPLEERP